MLNECLATRIVAMMENRNGLTVDAMVTQADGRVERFLTLSQPGSSLQSDAEATTESELMTVRVVGEPQRSAEPEKRNQADQSAVASSSGMIQIEAEKGRLILQGAVDPATLRVILERLLG